MKRAAAPSPAKMTKTDLRRDCLAARRRALRETAADAGEGAPDDPDEILFACDDAALPTPVDSRKNPL